ncbi:hypothetical protein V2J09_017393 [Rumex salicifolius]
MQFTVKSWSRNGRSRAGILHLPSSPMDFHTPCLLLSTRKALPHFLSPDLLASLPSPDSHLLQFSPLHFVEGLPTKTIASKCEVRKMAGLHHYAFVAVPRDSFFCLPEASAANKHAASFETPCGRLSINPSEYIRMVNSLRPDWWVSLADEVPVSATEKRNKASVDRTVRWLDECITSRETDGAVFGAIVGGSSTKEHKRCANEVVKRNVSGYWIGGLGLKETIADHPSLLRDVTDLLPIEKPRQVCGLAFPDKVFHLFEAESSLLHYLHMNLQLERLDVFERFNHTYYSHQPDRLFFYSLEEVLQGVAAGIDIFDSTCIYHLTLEGFALTFLINDTQRISCYELSTKINLNAKDYRHNTHHYLGFFRGIREAINEDRFEQFQNQFINSRQIQQTSIPVYA